MVFSSAIFVFVFLPIVLLVYYLAKPKYQNGILLLASLLFYAYGEPSFVLVMILSICLNYGFALVLGNRKNSKQRLAILWCAVIFDLGLLFIYKYLGFTQNILNKIVGGVNAFSWNVPTLPIGISFFTFQAMSYVIDVYRGRAEVQKNPLHVALYISFFPQLVAGPIVRYNTIAEQILTRTVTLEKFGDGVHRFILGLAKKVILANNLAVVTQQAFTDEPGKSLLMYWLGAIAFTLQIFFDFSGYSDMAIGLGKMFGFTFEENFRYPYISASITEFWRRWHISLSQWFRDYVYIPLGGSHVGKLRNIFNLFVIWLLTGIWHGANYTFVVWGLLQFVVQLFEKFIVHPDKRRNAAIRWGWRVVTILVIVCGWVIFNSESLTQARTYLYAMFGGNLTTLVDSQAVYLCWEYGAYLIAGILFSTPILCVCGEKIRGLLAGKEGVFFSLRSMVEFFLFLWAVSFIFLGSYNPFIYFNF